MAAPLFQGNTTYVQVPDKPKVTTDSVSAAKGEAPAAKPAETVDPTTTDPKKPAAEDKSKSKLTEKQKKMPEQKFPIPNVLHEYDSYTYNLGLAILTVEQYNDPDATYMKSDKDLKWICKSAARFPKDRVLKGFDFFIEELSFVTQTGLSAGHNTNVGSLTIKIVEPYSMGMLMVALKTAAWDNGHKTINSAPFLFTIDFFGNKNGAIGMIPKTSRRLSVHILNVTSSITEQGSVYTINAMPFDKIALTDDVVTLKTDVSVTADGKASKGTGPTVQEVLQTGENSLQTVLNEKLKKYKESYNVVDIPDVILITFPINTSSEATSGVTANSEDTVLQKLAMKKVDKKRGDKEIVKTYDQAKEHVNDIGLAKIGFSATGAKKNEEPAKFESAVYDPDNDIWHRGTAKPEENKNNYRFKQGSDIINAINQVILQSEFVEKIDKKIDDKGDIPWWRINTKTYIASKEVNANTGKPPYIYVYEVVPYAAHASKFSPPNKRPPVEKKKDQVVKAYNYFYTGKNIDIIDFHINMDLTFSTSLFADASHESMDGKKAESDGSLAEKDSKANILSKGNKPQKDQILNSSAKYTDTESNSEKKGGGGEESKSTRAARSIMDAVTSGYDMMNIKFTIIGDPYFIVHSGVGNYTGVSSQYDNLLHDGSVNYQNGETHISITFRNPEDINDTSGLYDFNSSDTAKAIDHFNGLYQVYTVTNKFVNGQFTQELNCNRIPLQESKKAESKSIVNSGIDAKVSGLLGDLGKMLDVGDIGQKISEGIAELESLNQEALKLAKDGLTSIEKAASAAADFSENALKKIGNLLQ